ncbi:hypothetical protein AMECASPLE_030627 [Ameca splendens]|uniref:Uncharacterized protein n=1 Tax=Ameca splendens TaxID=208324 RepID=A0ABV0Z3Y8_9TELE
MTKGDMSTPGPRREKARKKTQTVAVNSLFTNHAHSEHVCREKRDRPRDKDETNRSAFEGYSSYCLLCLSILSAIPVSPTSHCVFEWVKHCHTPMASRETLLQTDWRSTAKGSTCQKAWL